MKTKDLDNQDTFFEYDVNKWFTFDWSYILQKDHIGWSISEHCEVSGAEENIKYIKNLEDLKDTMELLTNETFRIYESTTEHI